MGLVLNYKVHGDGTIFNANQYPYPRHNLSENIVSAIFLDNRMRYYAISGDIWRFCPILRASAPFATPQIHGARIFSEPVDNEGTRRALSARAIANWTDEGDRSPENATFSRVLRSQLYSRSSFTKRRALHSLGGDADAHEEFMERALRLLAPQIRVSSSWGP